MSQHTDNCWLETPAAKGLTKLINMYFLFYIGYQHGIAPDLERFVLTNEELVGLNQLLEQLKKEVLNGNP